MLDLSVVAEREQHVITGSARIIAINVAGRVTKKERLVTTQRQKAADDVGVKQSSFNVDLGARRESGVAVLRNDPRDITRHAVRRHRCKRLLQELWRACELWRNGI